MRREQIIAIIVVVLLVAGGAAGYQFYFRPALAKFAEDQQYLQALNTKLNTLRTTFPGGKPEEAVKNVKAKLQPWQDTLEKRARQFTVRDFLKLDPLPKTDILKEYYAKTSQKMVDDLRAELLTKGVYYRPSIDFYFHMANPNTLAGKSVKPLEALYWLSTIKFGTSVARMLIDSDVLYLENLNLWTPRETVDGFTSHAVGVTMWMTMDQFCKFLEKLHNDDTMCVTVYGFRIVNTALRSYYDPPLRIEIVFQIDQYKYEPAPVVVAGGPAGSAPAGAPAAAARGPAAAAPVAATPGMPAGAEQLMRMRQMRNAAGGGNQDEASKAKYTSRSEMPWWRQMLPW